MVQTQLESPSIAAIEYAEVSKHLSLEASETNEQQNSGSAVQAKFVTPLDPVIETADGSRLPGVPVREAEKLNALKSKVENGEQVDEKSNDRSAVPHRKTENTGGQDENLDLAESSLQTYPPLFPPLPLYGPPSLLRNAQYFLFQFTSFYLSTAFLLVIVLGAIFTSIPTVLRYVLLWITFQNPDKQRPFHQEERRRATSRKEDEKQWIQRRRRNARTSKKSRQRSHEPSPSPHPKYEPLEGGPDKLVCDARYYARRVGLEMEIFTVQTEDGFLLDLWHVYDPATQQPRSTKEKQACSPDVFQSVGSEHKRTAASTDRYPVLLMHGLLQSAGAYCCNDEDSLAFYLHKAGYDVWLGNNRCGFNPRHTLLKPSDPRMWAWNIRQVGVMDLPAFVSRVLAETKFSKLGLVAHSQGTTEAFVALAKGQRPELGDKISVFCALAPAVYAGPLIGKMYFKFMKIISPGMFRLFFGIHAFIPLMMTMHAVLPAKLYGFMGYLVFGFMFDWSDSRWDKALRDRFYQFAPVYVSSESMRWWLGRECFAKHKCILSTHEESVLEEKRQSSQSHDTESADMDEKVNKKEIGWYNKSAPPFALWVAGGDKLVDGRRLLRRFEHGQEPHVRVVHSKVIEEYEHLDVLWAIDAIEKVGSEVKKVIWNTMSEADKARCRSIHGTS